MGETGQDSFQQDLEPEYVAFNDDASMAYIMLQENNAVAFVSLGATPKVQMSALVMNMGFQVCSCCPLPHPDRSAYGSGIEDMENLVARFIRQGWRGTMLHVNLRRGQVSAS